MSPNRSFRILRRLKQISRIREARAVRPLPGQVEHDLLSRIRTSWKNVPLTPRQEQEAVLPQTIFSRTFANRKGELYVVCRNALKFSRGCFLRIYKVSSRGERERMIASARLEVHRDGVEISYLSKNGEFPGHELRHPSKLRPRGLDITRPVVEEAITLARESTTPFVYLTTKGKKRMEHYQKFGFGYVGDELNHGVKMLLDIERRE